MVTLFALYYPAAIALLGLLAAAGALIAGVWAAVVIAKDNGDMGQVGAALVANTVGCTGAMLLLSFAKHMLGV